MHAEYSSIICPGWRTHDETAALPFSNLLAGSGRGDRLRRQREFAACTRRTRANTGSDTSPNTSSNTPPHATTTAGAEPCSDAYTHTTTATARTHAGTNTNSATSGADARAGANPHTSAGRYLFVL